MHTPRDTVATAHVLAHQGNIPALAATRCPPRMDVKPSEMLADSRDRIAQGWCQGHFEDWKGSVCSVGSMRPEVIGYAVDLQTYLEAKQALSNIIAEHYPNGLWATLACDSEAVSIPVWNDYIGRTQQEVLDIFDKTICALQEVGK